MKLQGLSRLSVRGYYSRLQANARNCEGVCRGGTMWAEGDVRVRIFIITDVATTSYLHKVPAHSCIYFNSFMRMYRSGRENGLQV